MVPPALERARPLLGTIVRVRVDGLAATDGHAAIDAAFAEIAAVHRLMSAQDPASEINRIGAAPTRIDARTRDCLARALHWAAASDGAFDPVVAGGAGGDWRALSLDDDRAKLDGGARIDLSGIAKGHAVDRACAVLIAAGAAGGGVDAGGDLRVFGAAAEEIALRPSGDAPPALVALADGALAGSDPALARAQGQAAHRDGRDGRPVADRFVAVAAPDCIDADALTKLVLALGDHAAPLLASVGAVAYRHDAGGWSRCPA